MAVALVCGGEFVAHTPLDAPRMLERIVETGATYVLGVPTHAIDLLSEMRRRGMATLGSVPHFSSAARQFLRRRCGIDAGRRKDPERLRHDREPLVPIYPVRSICRIPSRRVAAARPREWR